MLGGLSLLVYVIFPNDLVFRNYARDTNVIRTREVRKGVSMSLNWRAVITSALATAAFGVVPATATGDETPATILQLRRLREVSEDRAALLQGARSRGSTRWMVSRVALAMRAIEEAIEDRQRE